MVSRAFEGWGTFTMGRVLVAVQLLLVVFLPSINAQAENCPSGWNYYQRHCYLAAYDSTRYSVARTAFSSHSECLRYGSHLVSIRSLEERQSIISYLSTHANFGTATVSVIIGLRHNGQEFYWDDGRTFNSRSFRNWAPGHPVLGHRGGDCVYMHYTNGVNRDLWYTADCEARFTRWAMCKKPSVCGPSLAQYYFQNECYQFTSSLTHAQASSVCRETHGSELLMLESSRENQYISTWITSAVAGTWFWIGLSSASPNDPFRWQDGSSLEYENWLVNEPLALSTPRCVEMFKSSVGNSEQGKWRVFDCQHARPSLCSRKLPDDALVPLDDELVPILITEPQVPAGLSSTKCTSHGMQFALPFRLASPDRFSTPCLAGDVELAYLRQHWGNQAGVPGDSNGPLLGKCRCSPQRDDENQRWWFDFRYTDCGTRLGSLTPDKISYLNTIFAGELSPFEIDQLASGYLDSNHSGYDPESSILRLALRCDFNSIIRVQSFGYLVDIYTATEFNISGVGVFQLQSSFLDQNQELPGLPSAPSESPSELETFNVGRPVTFELELLTTHALDLRPLRCWLNTGEPTKTPRLVFIDDGCPVRESVTVGVTHWRNQTSRYQRLSYLAVAFVNQIDDTYRMHCTYQVCAPGNNQPCQRTCPTVASTSSPSVGRRKRQASFDEDEALLTVTSVPFRFFRATSSEATESIPVTESTSGTESILPPQHDDSAGSTPHSSLHIATIILVSIISILSPMHLA
ncbi:uncharacterized protein LOC135828168 isoform X1 [Sycon ciliatum]|uniref:uncharacterized protein LOC135828168 isoform X1 n=1 Tax=Sycon ciliatum TaxID=27933 RepID=UPI0031F6E460